MAEQFRADACCTFCDRRMPLLLPVLIKCAYDPDGTRLFLCVDCRLSLNEDEPLVWASEVFPRAASDTQETPNG